MDGIIVGSADNMYLCYILKDIKKGWISEDVFPLQKISKKNIVSDGYNSK